MKLILVLLMLTAFAESFSTGYEFQTGGSGISMYFGEIKISKLTTDDKLNNRKSHHTVKWEPVLNFLSIGNLNTYATLHMGMEFVDEESHTFKAVATDNQGHFNVIHKVGIKETINFVYGSSWGFKLLLQDDVYLRAQTGFETNTRTLSSINYIGLTQEF